MNRRWVAGIAAQTVLAGMVWAEPPPDWVIEAARMPAPEYPAKVEQAALLREEHLTVDAVGKRVMRERAVYKILHSSARPRGYRSYNTKSGKIASFRGWLIAPGGDVTELGMNKTLDTVLPGGDLYTEGRARQLECPASPEPGSVFAYEVTEQESTVFTQYQHYFQDGDPALVSRFALRLPPGWESKATIYNHAAVKPQASGGDLVWELRDLPPIEDEYYQPGWHSMLPRLALNYYPATSEGIRLKPVTSWTSVSEFLSTLQDPASEVTPEIQAKAASLTAGRTTEIDKIAAIAAFVQQTNYISVQMNTTRGGGYTPKPAAEVLRSNYGDCKEKSVLMKSLLRAVGIESYMVSIYSGDRDFVQPDWPSPHQFNHAITAIRVPAGVELPAVAEHRTLGRLLFFDPTSETTRLGHLPEYEQGSHALVVAGANGDLLLTPRTAPESDRVETVVTGTYLPDGRFQAELKRRFHGQSAAGLRSLMKLSPDEIRRRYERALSSSLGAMAMDSIHTVDATPAAPAELTARLTLVQFGQAMLGGRLLIVKPGLLSGRDGYALPAKERKTPIHLDAEFSVNRVEIKLPANAIADDLPEPVRIESPYGKFEASWKLEPGKLVHQSSLKILDVKENAAAYGKVRQFFEQVMAAQGAAVSLTGK